MKNTIAVRMLCYLAGSKYTKEESSVDAYQDSSGDENHTAAEERPSSTKK